LPYTYYAHRNQTADNSLAFLDGQQTSDNKVLEIIKFLQNVNKGVEMFYVILALASWKVYYGVSTIFSPMMGWTYAAF
jgi:hypothetical protein